MSVPISAIGRRAEDDARVAAAASVDEAMIERLVRGFYARVREDALIGPIFADRITDWETHLQRMCAFWSSVMLTTGRYHGQPMQKHLPLPVDRTHFDRWLVIFEGSARELCPPRAAEHFIDRARRIAESLELGIASANGVLLKKGDRFERPDSERSQDSSA